METFTSPIGLIVILAVVLFVTISSLVARYKRCPSDKILVIYGKTGGSSAKCIHGGGAFVWPVIQDYAPPFLPCLFGKRRINFSFLPVFSQYSSKLILLENFFSNSL